jgi:CheY-like chemotaxis protein
LAIVRQIVELHGGMVQAASVGEGHGATFTIQLPSADRGRAHAYERTLDVESRGPMSSTALSGRTVLIVEDHDDARELIEGVLENAGARVLSAATTREAIARTIDVRPDVLVADLGLPGEDGYALLARIRTAYPDLPALALTAYARESDRERTLAAGFQHHVVKPVDPQDLVQLIGRLI